VASEGSVTKDVYRLFRKRILHKDNRIYVTPVMLRHVRRYDLAATEIQGDYVLDAACGAGYGKDIIGQGRHYLGIDIDRDAIAFARDNFGGEFQHGSVSALDVESQSCDAVVSFETLEHLKDPEIALSEFARVLKRGGKLVGSIPLNHPDRIYHQKVYTFSGVMSLVERDEYATLKIFCQRHVSFTAVTEPLSDSDGGTVVFVIERM
jgi:SAM-dependent methyltransferase